jgi:Do/DeqQ family serine protease
MKLTKRMFSREFFFANLVLVGIVMGFAIALAAFGLGARKAPGMSLKAESPAIQDPAVQASIAEAEKVQGAFRWVSQQVLPVVVEVKVTAEAAQDNGLNGNPWRFFFNNPDDGGGQAPQAPRTEQGLGSGVIVERSGDTVYVLTNNHVAANATDITIVLYDKREFKGTLVGTDTRRDLAVVSFSTKDKDISLARLGDSDKLQVGDWAIAVGNPLGLESSVTTGTISALKRSGGPDGNISDFIQTDASINQGNSGGALANIRGEVVGINTWIASTTGGSVGLGFAIPINNAKRAVRDLIDKKAVKYGWLGIKMGELDPADVKSLGADGKKGAFVDSVFSGSPADKGGIIPGDFIVAMDDKPVSGYDQLTRLVGDLAPGTKTSFTLIRSGSEKKVSVAIEERDDKKANDNAKYWPGISVLPSGSPALKGALSKDEQGEGLFVLAIVPKTPAAGMGLAPRDRIIAINDKKVKTLKDFYDVLNAGTGKFVFRYLRDDKEYESPAYIRK